MHWSASCYAQPAGEPLSLTLAKQWLQVDHATDDTLIAGLIQAARVTVEKDGVAPPM